VSPSKTGMVPRVFKRRVHLQVESRKGRRFAKVSVTRGKRQVQSVHGPLLPPSQLKKKIKNLERHESKGDAGVSYHREIRDERERDKGQEKKQTRRTIASRIVSTRPDSFRKRGKEKSGNVMELLCQTEEW